MRAPWDLTCISQSLGLRTRTRPVHFSHFQGSMPRQSCVSRRKTGRLLLEVQLQQSCQLTPVFLFCRLSGSFSGPLPTQPFYYYSPLPSLSLLGSVPGMDQWDLAGALS